jgi:hypothetical protein
MTKGELIDFMSYLDDDTEILAMSAYDLDDGEGKRVRSISDAEEMVLYHDLDGDRPVIVLLYNDEED